jgi:beta-N-acetylhexosaminidase
LRTLTVSQEPTGEEIDCAIRLINTGCIGTDAVVILGTYNAHLYRQQGTLARAVLATGAPCIVVAMRNPYDIKEFPEAGTYIAAYGFRDCTMQAVAEVIFGLTQPSGKLPVSIPGIPCIGDGIVSTDAKH